MTLRTFTKIEPRYLVISNSPAYYGTPNPSTNVVRTSNYNSLVTCSIAGSPVIISATTQMVCSGFTRTVSPPVGTYGGTSTTFNITGPTTDAVTCVTWNWQAWYWLNVEAGGVGCVDKASQWCVDGSPVTLTAIPNWYSFCGWTGDTNGIIGDPTNLSIQVTMNQAKTLRANFAGTNAVTARGTRYEWIQQFANTLYWTTNNFANWETNDFDSDSLLNWQEYITGTDPNDSNSFFVVLGQGSLGASNRVTFYGHDHPAYAVGLPFGMLRCTNLISGPWESMGSQARTNGINTWWDSAPPANVPVFYRPVATNVW
jgi:hypothetical protein